MKLTVILILALLLGLLIWRNASAGEVPRVGDAAPDFRLPDQKGDSLGLTDLRGQWVVLYFYPKDDTPGCTEQACKFRDDLAELTRLGARVVGVSVDDSGSHAAFAKKYSLPFPLLADAGGGVASRYGSILDLGITKFAKRNTFLIDPQGRIAKVYLKADTSRNSREVIDDLKRMKSG